MLGRWRVHRALGLIVLSLAASLTLCIGGSTAQEQSESTVRGVAKTGAPTSVGDISVGTGISGGSVNIGLTPDQIRELMLELRAQDSAATAKVEELSDRLGVTSQAVAAFFRILGERDVPTEELPAKLAEIAARQAEVEELVGQLREQLSVTSQALANYFRILGEPEVSTAELPAKLAEIAERQRDRMIADRNVQQWAWIAMLLPLMHPLTFIILLLSS